jgi:hypothetical protein
MDHFGIGAAVKAIVEIYLQGARRTGRTTSLLDSLKNGDRVVFSNHKEANRVSRLLRERNLLVKCIVIDTKQPYNLFNLEKPIGKTLFDHSWVEQFYLEAVTRTQNEIDELQRQSLRERIKH